MATARTLWWVIAIAEGVLAGRAQAAGEPTSRPATLTIATYNINAGVEDAASLAEFARIIRLADADVVAIQEGSPALLHHLRTQLAGVYPVIHVDPGVGAGSFAWLSRYPLKNMRLVPHKGGYFDTPTAQIEMRGVTVQLAAVHLAPVRFMPGDTLRSVVARLAETDQWRGEEIKYIHSQLPAGLPTVVAGDFNSPSFLAAPGFMAGKKFVDSFASVTPDADLHSTWHWDVNNLHYEYRIDYIWHSTEFRTKASRIIQAGASDHYLLLSQIELVDGPATRP